MRDRILGTLRARDAFLAALATVDADGRPRVRYVWATIDDELAIRVPTFAETRKVAHVSAQPEVHMTCGDLDSGSPGSYFQIGGTATVETSPEERKRAWTARLEKWFSGPEDKRYAVIKIVPYRIAALPIGGGPDAEIWARDSIQA